jgi:predicted membrane protein
MPPYIEFFVVTFTMLGAFFLVFLLMFLLALFLAPIERELSKMVWANQPQTVIKPSKGSFKDFSKKH